LEIYGSMGRNDPGVVDLIDFVRASTHAIYPPTPSKANWLTEKFQAIRQNLPWIDSSEHDLDPLGNDPSGEPDAPVSPLQAQARETIQTARSAIVYSRHSKDLKRALGMSLFVPTAYHALEEKSSLALRTKLINPLAMGFVWKTFLQGYLKALAAQKSDLVIDQLRIQSDKALHAELSGNIASQVEIYAAAYQRNDKGELLMVQNIPIYDLEAGAEKRNAIYDGNQLSYDLDNFKSNWLGFADQPVFTYIIKDDFDNHRIIHGVPIRINQKQGTLFFAEITIGDLVLFKTLGVAENLDDDYKKARPFKKNDAIELLYPVHKHFFATHSAGTNPLSQEDEANLLYATLSSKPIVISDTTKPPVVRFTSAPKKQQLEFGFYYVDWDEVLVPSRSVVAYKLP
jgi:hypothetical protein